MQFHTVRLGEISALTERHPVVAESQPHLANVILPPLKTDDQDFPILFYAHEDGKIACYFKSFPDELIIADKTYPFAWNGNLMTMPDFRRRGLAQAIVEHQVQEFEKRGLVWGGVFSSAGALHLYNKLSFTMLGAVPRLCLVRNVAAMLRYHMPGFIAQPASGVIRLGAKARDALHRRRQPYRGKVTSKQVRPEDISASPATQMRHDPQQAYWDADTQWLLRRRNVRDVDDVFCVYLDGDNDPKGYIFLRERLNVKRPIREKYFGVNTMTLTHYGTFDLGEDTLEILLSAAIDRFWQGDADLFEVVTSCPKMQAAARRAGMISLGAGMSFKFHEPTALQGKLPRTLAAYKLTHYAGDAFSFE